MSTIRKAAFLLVVADFLVRLAAGQDRSRKPPPAPDTWERSKECAAQAEKVAKDRERTVRVREGDTVTWSNHYSSRYNRCFLQIHYEGALSGGGSFRRTLLMDAVERTDLASDGIFIDVPPENGCLGAVDAKACRDALEKAGRTYTYCEIEGQRADCDKTKEFIAERTKN